MRGYEGYDAVGLAELVRSNRVHPAELVDAAVASIERLNPTVNAVVIERFDRARHWAQREPPDGPFRGVPFLIKDIGANQAGLPSYKGNRALKAIDYRAPADTVLGARFRSAGFITLGKTNTPELGTVPTTQPLVFGPTANPWDLDRSPAGSSGGAAAAVAAGMVPLAHANDGGGSTRLPASWNGLVGLKPSRGRMPLPEGVSRLTAELCVARTVRDTAAFLDALHGHTPADLFQLPPPVRSYRDEVGADPGRLRIGLLSGSGTDTHAECVRAAELGARLLESLGHDVEPVDGELLFGGDASVNGTLWMAGIVRRVQEIGEVVGRTLTADNVEPYNWAAAQRGAATTAAELTRAQELQQDWVRRVIDWSSRWDLLVTPTSGCPPMRTDELWPDPEAPWRIGRTYGRIGRYTLPFNATGQPAISVPLHWTPDGLPVGTQLVAAIGREDLLLQVAAQLEATHPWAGRRPPIH